jgi:F-type H+-transporting ATPase subunit b
MPRYRLVLAALLLAALAVAAPVVRAQGTREATAAPAVAQQTPGGEAAREEGTAGDPGWMPTVWKAANFLILVGILGYFLREPLRGYLDGRIGKVREDLVTAAQTRETAVRQLAEIDAKLAALPAELEGLKNRGAEDLVAERARIEQDAQAERERLLEHTRREIEMRLRVAKRQLLEAAADLAVQVAATRITASITPADQARLVDRYAAQLQSGRPPEARS